MFRMTRVLLSAMFAVLFIASCSSPAAGITPVPSPTNTTMPPTITPTQSQATATKIPRPTVSDYCSPSSKSQSLTLPLSDAQGLNEDEIVRKLMELYLAYYHDPQAPDYCRLDEYHIDKVYYDEQYPNLPLEPKGDFMRKVLFSVKPVQLSNFWMVRAGELDQNNWLHLGENVAVFRSDSGYTKKFARP